jgi:hypothetical protein
VASAYGWVTILLYCLWLNDHIHYILTEMVIKKEKKMNVSTMDLVVYLITIIYIFTLITCKGVSIKVTFLISYI